MKDNLEILIGSSNEALVQIVRAGSLDAALAFEELDGRALGGNEEAREMILRLEKEIKTKNAPSPSKPRPKIGLLPPDNF